MCSRCIRKTVRPHLRSSEQLLAAVLAQNAGANAAMMLSALRGPIAAVDGIDVERDGRLTKTVTLRVRGAAIAVETARGQRPEDLDRALERARPHVRATAA